MPRKIKMFHPPVLNGSSLEGLEQICSVLNGEQGPAVQLALHRLVKPWQASGPNLTKMMHADVELWRDVQESWKTSWVPTNSGGAHLLLLPDLPKNKMEKGQQGAYGPTPEGKALVLFYALTLHPEWNRLGGPCERCTRYYVMKMARNKKYCARRCGSLATAIISTRKRLDKLHADKLRRAEAAAGIWLTIRTRLNWKQWVSRKEPDITPKWLTRAVNKGELQSPEPKRQLSGRRRRGVSRAALEPGT
jgi:hypothetical protein